MPKKNKQKFRFVHCADLHLGYKQYGLEERETDFYNAFLEVLEYVKSNEISHLIISGDIFHKKDISPDTLAMTEHIFEQASEFCKVILIEGNHDRKHSINEMSWLKYLHHKGVISLLSDDIIITKKLIGVDVGIIGLSYHGATTKKELDTYHARSITGEFNKRTQFNILTLHAGVVGVIPNAGNILPTDLLRFKEYFDCVLLGHIHKPYVIDDFIFNPGSTESCNVAESQFSGGFYDITITNYGIEYNHIKTNKRPIYRVEVDAWNIWEFNWKEKFKQLSKDNIRTPILEVTLSGEVKQKPDIDMISTKLKSDYNLLHVIAKDKTTRADQKSITKSGNTEEIEREVITNIYGEGEQLSNEYVQLIIDIKNEERKDPELLYKQFEDFSKGDFDVDKKINNRKHKES